MISKFLNLINEIWLAAPGHRLDRVCGQVSGASQGADAGAAAAGSAGREPVSEHRGRRRHGRAGDREHLGRLVVPGIVVEVMVKVGQQVKAGDPLFRLDDRELKAELAVRQAMLADAKAALERLDAMPRQEELPRGRSAGARSESRLGELGAAMGPRRKAGHATGRCREEEFMERKQSAMQARERYNRAVADLRPAEGRSVGT